MLEKEPPHFQKSDRSDKSDWSDLSDLSDFTEWGNYFQSIPKSKTQNIKRTNDV